jgi:hypothetical protein
MVAKLDDLFIAQAGQRGPFASDTYLRADIHQLLAVNLHFLR